MEIPQQRIENDRLASAAAFMHYYGLTASFTEGGLGRDSFFEKFSFWIPGVEVAEIYFVGGRLIDPSHDEKKRRQVVRGLATEVVEPLQSTAEEVYGRGLRLANAPLLHILPGLTVG